MVLLYIDSGRVTFLPRKCDMFDRVETIVSIITALTGHRIYFGLNYSTLHQPIRQTASVF